MTDDPRQILAEAGVECAEVDEWAANEAGDPWGGDAILALARLVAEYKAEDRVHVVDDPEFDTLRNTRPVELIFESDALLIDYPVKLTVSPVAKSVAHEPSGDDPRQQSSGTNPATDGR